jgi:hypothetical protein
MACALKRQTIAERDGIAGNRAAQLADGRGIAGSRTGRDVGNLPGDAIATDRNHVAFAIIGRARAERHRIVARAGRACTKRLRAGTGSGAKPRFSAPSTLVVIPEECQSIPITAPKD